MDCYKHSISAIELSEIVFESVCRQVQCIPKLDDMSELSELEMLNSRHNSISKQLESYEDEKRSLYESFVNNEIDLEDYRERKHYIDSDIARVKRSVSALEWESRKMEKEQAKLELAGTVSTEGSLTQQLADLLLEKIRVYPNGEVEVDWKCSDLFAETEESEHVY